MRRSPIVWTKQTDISVTICVMICDFTVLTVSDVVNYCLNKWDWSVATHLCHDLWLHCVNCFRRGQLLSQQTRLICRSPPAPMITTSTWISSQCYLQSTQSWFVPLVCGQRDVKSCRTNLRRHIDQRVVDHTKHSGNLVHCTIKCILKRKHFFF